MQNILVIGGAGYVGAVLVPKLLDQGYAVRVLDLMLFGEDVLPQHKNLEVIKGDMRDKDVLFAANAATVDTAKFLQFVRVVIATANDTVVTANNAQILRINLRQ